MTRLSSLFPLALLLACGPATVASGGRAQETVRVAGAGSFKTTSNATAHVDRLPFALGRVWKALPAAFEAVGVPITAIDTTNHVLSNGGLKVRRQLGSAPLGRLIDCGSTQIGENADTYDIYLTLQVQLESDEATGDTKLMTLLESMGKPVAFSGDYSRCSTRGVLEARLRDAVKAQIQ
jgi:hypothetical protein